MTSHPHLMEPLRLRSMTLRNRIVMGAMHTRLETLDRPAERLAAFFTARATGEAALLLTNGFSPNQEGRLELDSPVLEDGVPLDDHRVVCDAVHAAGGRIALQLLHAGRYAKFSECVGPSAIRARINPHVPRPLTTEDVWRTIDEYARASALAREAGYDGVEIMGSEGYLINQFAALRTNDRVDEFGGDLDGRLRLAVEVTRAVRAAVGEDFLVIHRVSALDLVEDGLTAAEVVELSRRVVAAGADVLNTGIGWHESQVPTIAATVPRAAWSDAVRRVSEAVIVPVIASNRINDPDVAEEIVASGTAALISMARPLLADPDFARKVREGRTDEINTCIACNQACLDRIFTERPASCLVNPRAGHELEFVATAPAVRRRIGVVGAGPAGLAFAVESAQRGHSVTLYDGADTIGGQLNMARVVPGKSEFNQLLRYFRVQLERTGVDVRLGKVVDADQLGAEGFDEVVIATGVTPRIPDLPGLDHPSVVSYVDVLTGAVVPGDRVGIIGAGGIGFDVAEYLMGDAEEGLRPSAFFAAWGVSTDGSVAGGVTGPPPDHRAAAARTITMFQRKDEPLGRRLGKSTGWILKSRLRRAGVTMVQGARYDAVDDAGLHYTAGGESHVLPLDTVVLCAGQESARGLHDQLAEHGVAARLIGGAHVSAELDAVAAIDEATRLAFTI
ncbi:FAD-dependent oxidoreductase [Pseudonocardia sp. GCM10023141]|uniref:oxidoreductase n=1 Tax=Pseudonocardia sp. GCM10023141 TaxID=3252653 RepID=UPI003605B968